LYSSDVLPKGEAFNTSLLKWLENDLEGRRHLGKEQIMIDKENSKMKFSTISIHAS